VGGYYPRRDDELQLLALQAIYEYWTTDGNNVTANGVPMIQTAFMSVWNWDARPFPAFPRLVNVWGDTGRWPVGDWLDGKGPFIPVLAPDAAPAPGPYLTFPAMPMLGWSVAFSPIFSTGSAVHVSGREVRRAKLAAPRWVITLDCDVLRAAAPNAEMQTIIGFFEQCAGENASFYFKPPVLSPAVAQPLGTGDGSTATFAFAVSLGGYALAPANVVAVSAVYLDGVAQAGGYTVNAEPMAPSLTFVTPPAVGVAVTADFHWSFLCRFDDDSEDVEEFMAALYALRSLKLRTVRS
jgi:uncharacterized protein (TIGR02217 family)